MKKALLINGYETYEGVGQNRLNRSLIEMARTVLEAKGYAVKVTEVEQGYDAAEEVEKHLWADAVFVQTPMYWFNVPGAFKTYIDRVYLMGYGQGKLCEGDGRSRSDATKRYGSGGRMHGCRYMLSTTWNAPASVFDDADGFLEGKSLDDSLLFLHKTYQFCGYEPLPSFAVCDVFKAEDCSEQVEGFRRHIERYF